MESHSCIHKASHSRSAALGADFSHICNNLSNVNRSKLLSEALRVHVVYSLTPGK